MFVVLYICVIMLLSSCSEMGNYHYLFLTWLDYNILLFLDCLKTVQNAAVRLFTRPAKRLHVTPVLSCFHWLSVIFRIQFKILVMSFRALHDVTGLLCR